MTMNCVFALNSFSILTKRPMFASSSGASTSSSRQNGLGFVRKMPNSRESATSARSPLDDANIGRFVRMLNQFKSKTQFIVITHNPRTTTEAADAVYGVTMQEPGVSSIVSVRMRGSAVEELADILGNGAEPVAAASA